MLSLRSAPARLLAEVSADFSAALSSSNEGGLQVALTRFYGDRLRELSARAGFGEDEDGDDEEQQLEEEEENDENRMTTGGDFLAAVLRPSNASASAPERGALPASRRAAIDAPLLMGPRWVSQVAAASAAARLLGAAPAADAAAAAAAAAALRRRAAAQAAKGGFERGCLPAVRAWAAAVPPALLEASLSSSSSAAAFSSESSSSSSKKKKRRWLRRWRALLDAYAHEAVGTARASQLFDACVDWPASTPAVDDLRAALFFNGGNGNGNGGSGGSSKRANGALRSLVAETFGAETRRRLLHAGAATADVIAQYVSTVRCLRRLALPPLPPQRSSSAAAPLPLPLLPLPPRCSVEALALEHRVTAPVRAYLRRRADAVRCVVGALAGRGGEGGEAGPLSGLLDEEDEEEETAAGGDAAARQRQRQREEEEEEAARLAASSAEYGGTGGASDADDDPDEAGRIARALAWDPPPSFFPSSSSRRGVGVSSSLPLLAAAPDASSSSSSSSGAGGAVSLLASAFGGPDVLIDAFRSHAGRALLACRGGGGGGGAAGGGKAPTAGGKEDPDEEQPLLVGLELLRARFGDRAALVPAEVMLKDVADSRRLLSAVRTAAQQASRASKEGEARRRRRHRRGEETDETVSAPSSAIPAHLSDAATRKTLRRVSALVTSSLFWPRGLLPTETYVSPIVVSEENDDSGRGQRSQPNPPPPPPPFELPPALSRALDAYGAHFSALKAPRRLVWRPTAGVVTLEVEVAGKKMSFSATPLEASLLLKFSSSDCEEGTTKAEWRASELAAALKVKGGPGGSASAAAALSTVVRAAGRWVSAGLLSVVSVSAPATATGLSSSSSSDPLYRRASALPSTSGEGSAAEAGAAGAARAAGAGGGAGGAAGGGNDDDDEAPEPENDDAANNAQMLEAFVLGMLTNFEGGLPTDRIHSMLKMFATDPPYEAAMGATAALLARMSREEKLIGEGSVWRKK